MSIEINTEQSYESFFEDVWDYVSQHIVDDDMWEKHIDDFQEVTFDLYQFYVNTSYIGNTVVERIDPETHEVIKDIVSTRIYPITSKICARMIESFVKNFSKELS